MKRTCNKYFFNNLNIYGRLNYLPQYGDAATGYTWTNYKPYLILARAGQSGAVPNGSAGNNELGLFTQASQVSGLVGLQSLYQNIISANLRDNGFNQSGKLQFTKLNDQLNFEGYMSRYFNDDILLRNLWAISSGALAVTSFWVDEDGSSALPTFDNLTYERFFEKVPKYVFEHIDPRLWMPPGTVTINGVGNVDGYYIGVSDVGGSLAGESGYLIIELNSLE